MTEKFKNDVSKSQANNQNEAALDELPTFNLKAVVRETSLKPDTLRAWERRYGLPNPRRTPGGHRLYSQRDIDTLKWLMERQDEGLSISRAVDLWHRLETDGQDPLQEEEEESDGVLPIAAAALQAGDPLIQLRQQWIDACLEFDEQRAEQTLAQVFALYPIETAVVQVLQKGLADIGLGWYEGNITAQQEHFASALAMRRLETLVGATPPPTRQGRVLIACPPEEEHTFGPLLLTLMMRRRGWNVVYLGANVPLARLESTIKRARPQLVVFTAQTLPTVANMLPMTQLLQRDQVPCAYGGLIFTLLPTLRDRLPGYYLGDRLDEAPQIIDDLLSEPPRNHSFPVQRIEMTYIKAVAHYRDRQAMIEAQIWDELRALKLPDTHLARANSDFSRYIKAALTLGDINLLGDDIAWVEAVLTNLHYRIPSKQIRNYLNGYLEACRTHLDERGAPLIEWLEHVLEE